LAAPSRCGGGIFCLFDKCFVFRIVFKNIHVPNSTYSKFSKIHH
jgi:hypothetical protein